jgi:tRNA A37 N6-isopentenylltransferase MiaA
MYRKIPIIVGGSIVCLIVILIGFTIRINTIRNNTEYKNELKQYVTELNNLSEEEKMVIYIAIDHIKNPETIKNNRLIAIYRISEKYPAEMDIDIKTESGIKIQANDWQVDIGDSHQHGNFSAIIDGDTLEFIMQIPIA